VRKRKACWATRVILPIVLVVWAGACGAAAHGNPGLSLEIPQCDPALRTVVGLLRQAQSLGEGELDRVRIPVFCACRDPHTVSSLEDAIALPDNYALAWMSLHEIDRLRDSDGLSYQALAGSVCRSEPERRFADMPQIALDDVSPPGTLIGIIDSDFRLLLDDRPDLRERTIAYWDRQVDTMRDRPMSEGSQGSVHGSQVLGIVDRVVPAGRYILVATPLDQAGVVSAVHFVHGTGTRLGRPCVVNLSCNTPLGPHDGTSLFERIVSSYAGSGFLLVVSAGNGNDQRQHIEFDENALSQGMVEVGCRGENKAGDLLEVSLDLWFDKASPFEVIVSDACGVEIGRARPGESVMYEGQQGVTSICNDLASGLNGCANIFVLIKRAKMPSDASDEWTVRLRSLTGRAFVCNGWISSVPRTWGDSHATSANRARWPRPRPPRRSLRWAPVIERKGGCGT
jgi:hypothetical protein